MLPLLSRLDPASRFTQIVLILYLNLSFAEFFTIIYKGYTRYKSKEEANNNLMELKGSKDTANTLQVC